MFDPMKLEPAERQQLYERLADEFRTTPIGEYGAELQRVLNYFRSSPDRIRYALICTEDHREWKLAMLPDGRGEPVKVFEDKVYRRLEDVEWEVFNLRWKAHFGGS